MKITLNSTTYIEYDNMNFTPFFWQEEKTSESGAHKGKTVPAKFVSSQKYFGTLAFAVKWCVAEQLVSNDESVSISEFVQRYEAACDKMVADVRAVRK